MKELLQIIITKGNSLGLPESDTINAEEFLEYNEFGLCLETIVNQIYEYDIKIDKEFYQLVLSAANGLSIPTKEVDFIKELL